MLRGCHVSIFNVRGCSAERRNNASAIGGMPLRPSHINIPCNRMKYVTTILSLSYRAELDCCCFKCV